MKRNVIMKNVKFFAIICVLTVISSAFSFAASAAKLPFNLYLNASTGAWANSNVNNKSDDEQMVYVTVNSKTSTTTVVARAIDNSNAVCTEQINITTAKKYTGAYTKYCSGGTAMRLSMRASTVSQTVTGVWNS